MEIGNSSPRASLELSQVEGSPPRFKTELPKSLTCTQEALVNKLVIQYRAHYPTSAGTPIELAAINKQLGLAGEPFTLTFIKPIYGSPIVQSTGTGTDRIASPDGTGIIGPRHTMVLVLT